MSTISYNGQRYTEEQFRAAANVIKQHKNVRVTQRDDFIQELGKQYSGDRDIYEVLGYDDQIEAAQFRAKFERQDIARRVVELPAEDTWKEPPTVSDTLDSQTQSEFDRAIEELENHLRIWNVLSRVDVASGIGEYGLLFMGLSDGQDLSEPVGEVSSVDDLAYVTPFSQDQVIDWQLGKDAGLDPSDERYNKPVIYEISFTDPDEDVFDNENTEVVHWERVVHVAEGKIASELKGTPRLRPIFNRLEDLEKVLGSSAEMFWSGADEKYHFNIETDDTQRIDPNALDDLDDEVQNLVHDMEKAVKTFNTDLEVIGGQEVNPEGVVSELLKFVSGATGIPKRMLTGSERGELASSQDRANWLSQISSRRERFAGPEMVRPFFDRLISFGILPAVDSYDIDWPSLFDLTKLEKAKVQERRANTVKTISQSTAIASTDQLFDWVVEGEVPELEDVEPMQSEIPAETAQRQFERSQSMGEGSGSQSDFEQPESGNDRSPSSNEIQFGEKLLRRVQNGRQTDLLKELLNRIHGRNVALGVNRAFDPIKHPRNPDTGKFVERPYSVPSGIAGMDTEDIVRELARDVDDFGEVMDGATIDMDADMEQLIEEETSDGGNVGNLSISPSLEVAPKNPMTMGDESDIEGVSYEDISSTQKNHINIYLNDSVPEMFKNEEDTAIASSYSTIKDDVERSSNGNNTLKLARDATVRVFDHEFGHQYLQTYGFDVDRDGIVRANNSEYFDGPVPESEVHNHTFTEASSIEIPVQNRREFSVGDTVRYQSQGTGGTAFEEEITDIDDDGTLHLTGETSIDPEGKFHLASGRTVHPEGSVDLSKKLDSAPERVQRLAEQTDKAWVEANETFQETDSLDAAAKKLGGTQYGLSNSHEAFTMMHEAMQSPMVSNTDPGKVAQQQPDWVRTYAENFRLHEEAIEAIQRANPELHEELTGGDS